MHLYIDKYTLILYKCTTIMYIVHYELSLRTGRLVMLQANELNLRFCNIFGTGKYADLSKAHFRLLRVTVKSLNVPEAAVFQ